MAADDTPADDRLVEDLADAILDGNPVDWAAAESSAEGAARPLIEHLKLLAEIADVHRRTTLPTEAADSLGGSTRSQAATISIAAPSARAEPPAAGSWGTLRLFEKLGEGSFAEVYRAWDARLDREVALKLLRRTESEPAGVSSTVIEEGRMLARVRHPNVVLVHGADRIDGRIGLWMELIHGRTLEQVLREQGPFGVQEATVIALDLCRALSAVHRAGLLHRDIKAQNVMREDGGRIVLMDFGTGLAAAESDGLPRRLAGTPLYLAPEIFEGRQASKRSDIYSLGVLLYHLLTGKYPVGGRSLHEVRLAHERGERTALTDVRPDLPEEFVRLVERALARDPQVRHESAGAMEAGLIATLGAAAPGPPPRRGGASRRLLGGAAALALAAVTGLGFLLGKRAAPAPAAMVVPHVNRLTELAGIEEFPAISPDGKSVAFTAYAGGKRQIFVRLIASGPPLQLTSDPVDHLLPRWSPDSSSLLYYSPPAPGEAQGTLWEISALGGASRRVTNSVGGADLSLLEGRIACFRLAGPRVELVAAPRDGSAFQVVAALVPGSYYLYPRWSPDGKWIAFQRGDGVRFDVFVVPAAGGDPRQLTHDQSLLSGFTWLPDSTGIVFSSSRASTLPYLPTFSLWEARIGDRRLRQLTSGESSFEHPDVNQAGTMVAGRMRMQFDIWKFPVDGTPRENVDGGLRMTRQTGYVQTPTVAPGDKEVAFLSDSGGHTNLWALDAESGQLRQITNERDPSVAVGVPIWSPDGSSIAFVSSRGNPGLWFGIWLVNPDGSNLRKLVERGLGAAWSADGQWLYYIDEALKKIPARGGTPVKVRAEGARNVIGAHGSTLYYTVERPLVDGRPEFEIRAATPEGGPSRLLAQIPASRVANWQIVNPALSPDGKYLVQPLTDDRTTNLWALSTTTGEWRQLTDFGERSTFIARRVSWSSDGRFIFAAVGEGDADIVLLEGLVNAARQ